ncbi:hypothetical protein FB567DRAFT_75066 [Paraphoma chrysanthemicola]|uniref:Uncharacterized protein n=1 Tax=Paraphoma chrysanthemicola TaxID=798071 RepID=A0A8K0R754_9PLEO|nr:hypothetical protein FB567DRAFT_75066 [Paraphoma chrysanthemicola]
MSAFVTATAIVTASGQRPSATEILTSVIVVTPSVVTVTNVLTPGSSASLPRLVTAYTQSPECATRWLLLSSTGGATVTSGNFANDLIRDGIGSSYWRPCYASAPTPAYSPGICYSGQTPAIIQQALIQASSNGVPQTRWQALCCPSGMFPTNFRQCEGTLSTPFTALAPVIATVTSGSSLSRATIWDGNVTQAITTTGFDGRPATLNTVQNFSQTTVISNGKLWAEPVTVYWQAEDLSLFPSVYASSLASAIGISFGNESKSEGSSSRGLSVGAIVGIAVGAVVLAFLIGGGIFLILLRRRKQQPHTEPTELSGQSNGFRKLFGGKWRAEVDGNSKPAELESKHVYEAPVPPAELEATERAIK